MKLLIVESPAKAKTMGKYLGSEFVVTPSNGHVRSLPSKKGSVLPEENFAMIYEGTLNSSKVVPKIVALAKQASTIYLATDPDREGEAIAWHIVEMLKDKKAIKDDSKIFRVTFYEITKSAVLKAISEPRALETSLIKAQQARQALDYLVGFTLSPLLWKKLPTCRSAGRVQSVALRLICEREMEILTFVSQEYWSISIDFHTQTKQVISTKLIQLDGKKLEKLDIQNEEAANLVTAKIQNHKFSIFDIRSREQKRNPLPPFNTSTLQQEASNKLGFSVKKTMTVAQGLYEGISISGEERALITYMRTDGVTISDDALKQIRDFVVKIFDKNHIPSKPNVYKTKTKNAQEAHEAIRPIECTLTPEILKNHLNPDQYKLYKLIWNRTIASQMNPATVKILTLDITSQDQQILTRANESVVDPAFSYLALYNKFKETKEDEEKEEITASLPLDISKGQNLDLLKVNQKQHFTEPSPRFTEASLVKALEELGIGRPSTYGTIISVLQERNYVTLEQKRFVSDPRGAVLTNFLTQFFSHYFSYDFTANLENQLDSVANGDLDWKLLLQNFWSGFYQQVQGMEGKTIEEITDSMSDNLEKYVFPKGRKDEQKQCPNCKSGDLKLKFGKFGMFLTCAKYPECKFSLSVSSSSSESGDLSATPKESFLCLNKDGGKISFCVNRYGSYLQVESKDATQVKKINLPKEYTEENMTFELAQKISELPKIVCNQADIKKHATANAQAEAAQARADAAAAAAAAAAAPAGGAAVAAAPAVANVLKDLKVKLDKFLGRTDPKSVDTWLDNLEDYCVAHTIAASADKTFVAQYHLDGEIKDWFKLFTDSTGVKNNKAMDFDEFKRELTKASLDSTHSDDIKKDFAKLAQTGPAAKYVEAFRKWHLRYNACAELTNVNYYSDAILLDAFMTGLKKEVRVHVKMAKPATLQAAYDAAKDADAIVYTPPARQTGGAPRQPGIAGTGSPHPYASPASSRFGSRAGTPAPVSALEQGPLAPLLELANLIKARASQSQGSASARSLTQMSGQSTIPQGAAPELSAIDWGKAGVTMVNGVRRVQSMKDNPAMREYCRQHKLCFRCRSPDCPWGACKNMPSGQPGGQRSRFSNVEGGEDLIDLGGDDGSLASDSVWESLFR